MRDLFSLINYFLYGFVQVSHWKVLLIEAGGNEPTGTQIPSMFQNYLGSAIDWNYLTEPENMACLNKPEKRCTWPRGKVKKNVT